MQKHSHILTNLSAIVKTVNHTQKNGNKHNFNMLIPIYIEFLLIS
ncbi:hypothetical protein NOVO_03495 [Rickettsiales bacterium Ac37b]|nr:hypothetical protein NOVO_03495 [Rickettsiales bacterium Ac37b]